MRTFLLLSLLLLALAACKNDPAAATETNKSAPVLLGKKIETPTPTSPDDIIKKLDDTSQTLGDITIDGNNVVSGLPATIEGKITDVCKTAGCWSTITTSEGKEITMLIKDKLFKMPSDATGKTVIAQGGAYKSVTTVEELRQIAKSNGSPAEKIAEINNPSVEYFFSTEGIILKP